VESREKHCYSPLPPKQISVPATRFSVSLALAAEEIGVLVLELVADIVHLTGGYRFLQDEGNGPGVAYGARLVRTFLVGDPPVELCQREALPSAFAPQWGCEVLGELRC
jgi:hypothetical protein